jgi:hypothetical protein
MSDEASSTTAPGQANPEVATRRSSEARRDNEGLLLRQRLMPPFRKKAEFISDLMYKLDLAIYAELVFLYYLECAKSNPLAPDFTDNS